MFFCKLLKCKIKQYIKAIPAAICSSMVFILLISLLFYLIFNLIPKDEPLIKTDVALINNDLDENTLTMGLNMLNSFKSTSLAINVVEMNKEQALKKITTGEIIAMIELPENVYSDIIHTQKCSVNIFFSKTNPLSETILTELTRSGAKMISSSQIFTQTYVNINKDLEFEEDMQDSFNEIDLIGYKYVLNRESTFYEDKATSSINKTIKYYITGIFTLLFFFISITFASVAITDNNQFLNYCKKIKLSPIIYSLSKIIALTINYFILEILLLILLNIISKSKIELIKNVFNKISFNINLNTILYILLIALFMSTYTHLIFFITKQPHEGIIGSFIMSIIMAFTYGLIIPSDFMPSRMLEISKYLPFKYTVNCFNNIIYNETEFYSPLFIFIIINTIIIFFCTKLKSQRN